MCCIFSKCEHICNTATTWDDFAIFVCSISLTATILQGATPLREWWKNYLRLSLQKYGTQLIDETYSRSGLTSETIDKYLTMASRKINQKISKYDEKFEIDDIWKSYTKKVYLISFILAIVILANPNCYIKLFYLLSVYPLLSQALILRSHWITLKKSISYFIQSEDTIKTLIKYQEEQSYNL